MRGVRVYVYIRTAAARIAGRGSALIWPAPMLLALVLALAPGVARAQQPSAALAAKSLDADRIAARLAQGPVRIIVHHREPETADYAARGTRRESIAAITRDLAALQDGLIARHFAARTAAAIALRRMQVTPAFAVTAGPAEIESLANDPNVLGIALDQVRKPVLVQSVPLVGMPTATTTYGATGGGFAVAIIDSGVDKTHTFLANVIAEACYSTTTGTLGQGGSASTCPGGASSSSAVGSGVNCNIAWSGCEHGTHVAGIAAGANTQFQAGQPQNGVARGAGIIAIKAASEFTGNDCSPGPSPCIAFWDSDMMAALDHVYAIRASLPAGYVGVASANLSIGGGAFAGACDSSFPAFKTSIDNLRAANIATVIAAGNSSSTSQISFPACISSAIAVAASSKSDTIAYYSNINAQVALFAPGGAYNGTAASLILSSVPAGFAGCASDGIAFAGPNPATGGSYCYLQGTSMATPHVTGAFAAIRSALPNATVSQILAALQSTGIPITDTRSGGTVTKPRIRVDLALRALGATAARLQVTPSAAIMAAGPPGGPFAPASFQYLLSASAGSVAYQVTGLPTWLSASSTSGTVTTAGAAVTFTVNASANTLAPGPYTTTVTILDNTSGQGTTVVNATLTVQVTPTCALAATPATLNQGETATLSWTSSNATGGAIDNGVGAVATSGSATVTPAQTTTYTAAFNGSGGTGTCQTTVTVVLPTLSVQVSGGGTVTSVPAGINCGTTCSAGFAGGTAVTLTATPAAGATFAGWGDTCNGAGACTVTVAGAQNVLATFSPAGGGGGPMAPRTWVSGLLGNDANACTRDQPCLTFAGALARTEPGGEINCIDSGDYGPVTITRAVTISCEFVSAGVLASGGGDGIDVNAGASDVVVLRGLSVEVLDSGNIGVSVTQAGAVHVERCVIRGFALAGINFTPANMGAQLFVRGSSLAQNGTTSGTAGIRIKPTTGSASFYLEQTQANDSPASRGLMADTTGAAGGIQGAIVRSVFAGNALAGIVAQTNGGPAINMRIDQTVSANNGTYGVTTNGSGVVVKIGRSTVSGNATGMMPQSGQILSFGDNQVDGNGSNGAVSGLTN
jgi:subtilisin family serine protease